MGSDLAFIHPVRFAFLTGQYLCTERGGQVSLILQMQFGLLSAANSENWFYRYSLVFCSLQVFLGGREITLKDLN